MTYLMPLIVTEVSAMLVDTTTFLDPWWKSTSKVRVTLYRTSLLEALAKSVQGHHAS